MHTIVMVSNQKLSIQINPLQLPPIRLKKFLVKEIDIRKGLKIDSL